MAECVELAKAATSNEIRSHHYAIAEHYLRLAEAEEKLVHRDNSGAAAPASKPGNKRFSNRERETDDD